MIKALPVHRPSQTMVVESLGPVREVRDQERRENDESSEMDDDSEEEKEEEEEEQLVSFVFVSCAIYEYNES